LIGGGGVSNLKKKCCVKSRQIDREQKKVHPIIGAVGNFVYDITTDRSEADFLEQVIYNLKPDKRIDFSQILSRVDTKYKTKFQEMSVGFRGPETEVLTAPILLSNGNIVEEKYKFVRDKDFGLLKIIGQTKLLQMV
jgi:hypothetical protein